MIVGMRLRFNRRLSLVALLLLALFLIVATIVHFHPTLAADRNILIWINSYANPSLDMVFRAITTLGNWVFVLGFTAALVTTLYRNGQTEMAALSIIAIIGSLGLNTILKHLFSRVRPELWEHVVREYSFSFPSGHAMASLTLALIIAYVTRNKHWRHVIALIAVTYVVLIGISRLYLGVHYPSDILGGWLIAAAWVLFVISIRSGSKRYTV
jgi:undecaprenyl-diphosphatase